MSYTEGHKELLIKTIKSLPAKRRCLFCDSSQLEIGAVIDTTEYNDGVPAALIQLVCRNCGYVHLFNAIALGVVDKRTGVLKEAE